LSTRQLVSFLSTSIRTKYDKVHTSTSRYKKASLRSGPFQILHQHRYLTLAEYLIVLPLRTFVKFMKKYTSSETTFPENSESETYRFEIKAYLKSDLAQLYFPCLHCDQGRSRYFTSTAT